MNRVLLSIICLSFVSVVILSLLVSDNSNAEGEDFTVGDYRYEIYPGEADSVKIVEYLPESVQKDIVVPDSVDYEGKTYTIVAIGSSVFSRSEAETITVGDSCKSVGSMNFNECLDLKKLVLGENVETIGAYSICDCPKLTDVKLSKKLNHVDTGSFLGNENLSASGIDIPVENKNVTTDGDMLVVNTTLMACLGLTTLEEYSMKPTITSVSDHALEGQTNIKKIQLSDNLTSVGRYAFQNCTSLKEVKFSDKLINIDVGAFRGCTALESVDLPESLRMIDNFAFQYCQSLSHVSIQYDVAYIGIGAFSACDNLSSMEIDDLNDRFVCENGILYQKGSRAANNETILQFLQGYKVDGGILDLSKKETISIESYAFTFSMNGGPIKTLILPGELQVIKYSAFNECYGLECVDIPGTVSLLDYSLFENCSDLKKVILHEGTDDLDGSFYLCPSLTDVTIPSSVKNIGGLTFYGCTSLTEITLPDCAVTVEAFAFADCTSLKKITIPNAGTMLEKESLAISIEGTETYTIDLVVAKGFNLPDDACGSTECNVQVIGELPYPYENWVVIVIIVLIMVGLLRFIRRV